MFFKKKIKKSVLSKEAAINKIKATIYNDNKTDWLEKLDIIMNICDRAKFSPEQKSTVMAKVCYIFGNFMD